jgi:hypothetical protein
MKRALVAIVSFVLVAQAGPATAEFAKPDQAFLDEQVPKVETMAEEVLETSPSPRNAVDAVRRLLLLRQDALLQLNQRTPLTTFDGIETQDMFDDVMVRAIHEIILVGMAADTTSPPEEDIFLFAEAVAGLPPLGESPIGFMVLGMVQNVVTAADTMVAQGLLPLASADKLCLRTIHHATELYRGMAEDIFTTASVGEFRQNSVLMRLRCSKDEGTYKINNMKSSGGRDGSISRVYYLQCNECGEPIVLHFPLHLATELHKRIERQDLKEKPTATRPDAGLDP